MGAGTEEKYGEKGSISETVKNCQIFIHLICSFANGLEVRTSGLASVVDQFITRAVNRYGFMVLLGCTGVGVGEGLWETSLQLS